MILGLIGSVLSIATTGSARAENSVASGATVGTFVADSKTVAAKTPKKAAKKKTPKKKPKVGKYSPKTGVIFNEPYNRGGKWRFAIRAHLIKTIDSVKKGQNISFASWNIRGAVYRDALIRAHNRGVRVRIIMDRGNNNAISPNPDVNMIRAEFKKKKNQNRKAKRRSKVKMCVSSCRGGSGIAHTKFFQFSKAGKSKWITMYSSNNATDIAAIAQWNDMFTVAGRKSVYKGFHKIFNQMWKDKRRKNAFQQVTSGRMSFDFYPYYGKGATGDPDMKKLNQVTCSGATGGTGTRGKTRILMAQDALLNERGIRLAKKLVKLRKQGCDIKIVYALLGKRIRTILDNGGVRTLQYSYDRDRDGLYDIYLHMKSMAISGNFGGKSNAQVVYNGTANWTPVALASDEVVAKIAIPRIERRYAKWINFLFNNRPPSWGPINLGVCATACATGGIDRLMNGGGAPKKYDPYAWMKEQGL